MALFFAGQDDAVSETSVLQAVAMLAEDGQRVGAEDVAQAEELVHLVEAAFGSQLALDKLVIQTLMDDPALRVDLGARAAQSVRGRYSLPAVLADWDRLFADVRGQG